MLTGLGNLAETAISESELEDGQAIVQLVFKDAVSISTLKEMQEQSKLWRRIFVRFARMVRTEVSDVKIVSIDRGSIVFELLADTGLALALAMGAKEILQVYKTYLESRKLALEIDKLENEKKEAIKNLLEEGAKETIDKGANDAAHELLQKNGWPESGAKYKRLREIIANALKEMLWFVDRGGIRLFRHG